MKNIKILLLVTFILFQYNLKSQECMDLGTNLGELPTVLVDVFKSSRTFWETDLVNWNWDTGNPLPLDANGYPTSINSGYGARTLLLEALDGNYPTGTYTLLYDGEGTIELGMDATNPVFTNNGGTDNRITFQVNTTTNEGIMVDIVATTPGNHIHNIRIIRPDMAGTDFVNTYNTQAFIPLFYERLSNYKIVRFMDWMSTNWSAQEQWSDRPTLQSQTWAYYDGRGGVPVEIMVQVANDLNADPWFCMPHQATDNYMTQFANYVNSNLNNNLNVYIEYSNEVWNGLFSTWEELNGQSTYAEEQAAANGISDWAEGMGYWVGRRSAEMFDLWEEAFTNDSRLQKVLPIQTGTGLSTPFVLNYNHNGTPLYQIGDLVSGAGYFEGNYQEYDLESMNAEQLLDSIEANLFAYDSGPYWTLETVNMLNNAPYNSNPLPFICYEGGQHLANWWGAPEDPVTQLLIDVNRHPRMGEIYETYLNWWRDNVGASFVHFSSWGTYSMWGSWGELEYITQDPATSPKYTAIQNWIANNPESACLSVSVPVELIDFSGAFDGRYNVLQWQTASEVDFDFFELEKRNEEGTYTTIFKTQGVGNSSEAAQYQYTDKFITNTISYYRLKMIDRDGSFEYSKEVAIKNTGSVLVSLYPNLVQETTTLEMNCPVSGNYPLHIVNASGQRVQSFSVPASKGKQRIELNVSELEEGIYFLYYPDRTCIHQLKFIKL